MDKREIFKLLENFSNAARELSNAWIDDVYDEFMVECYPFDKSFDEMTAEIEFWKDVTEKSLKKKYRIGLREIWEQMYEVEASSMEEAEEMVRNGEGCIDNQFELIEVDQDDPYIHYSKENEMGFCYPIKKG